MRLAIEQGAHAALAAQLLHALGDVALRSWKLPETGETLSPREIEVLRLVAQGASNRAIAERLVLSEEAVKSHVARILRKLDVASRTRRRRGRAHSAWYEQRTENRSKDILDFGFWIEGLPLHPFILSPCHLNSPSLFPWMHSFEG